MPGIPVVVLTQEHRDNEALAQLLQPQGISAVSYPCIQIKQLRFSEDMLPEGRTLAGYRLIAFSSRRGVSGMTEMRDVLAEAGCSIACVGRATADAVREVLQLEPAIIASDQTGTGLAKAILAHDSDVVPLLLVRGSKTSGTFQSSLRAQGWEVDEAIVYEHADISPEPLDDTPSCIASFASPSAAITFFAANNHLLKMATCISIGPVTTKALSQLGADRIIEAAEPSQGSLAQTIITAFQEYVSE